MKDKTIILLIGKKGSGKSFIGKLIEDECDIKFVRVEDQAMNIKRNRNITDESYLNEVFKAIEEGVKEEIAKYGYISFESLGLSAQFDEMVKNLRKEFNLITIKITCDSELCMQRVRSRDQSIHINISADRVNMLNSEVEKRNYRTDYIIDNSGVKREDLTAELKLILNKSDACR